jgi:hypothetical protein
VERDCRAAREAAGVVSFPRRCVYLANVVPLSRDWRAAIRADAKWLESFSEDAFLRTEGVPVTAGHDCAVIGRVASHATSDCWHVFALMLDEDSDAAREASDLIRVGTGVSVQAELLRTDAVLEESGVRRCMLARLDHVAVLLDGERPMYAGAGVMRILDLIADTCRPRMAKAA